LVTDRAKIHQSLKASLAPKGLGPKPEQHRRPNMLNRREEDDTGDNEILLRPADLGCGDGYYP
jgi:hypothetical protein